MNDFISPSYFTPNSLPKTRGNQSVPEDLDSNFHSTINSQGWDISNAYRQKKNSYRKKCCYLKTDNTNNPKIKRYLACGKWEKIAIK